MDHTVLPANYTMPAFTTQPVQCIQRSVYDICASPIISLECVKLCISHFVYRLTLTSISAHINYRRSGCIQGHVTS